MIMVREGRCESESETEDEEAGWEIGGSFLCYALLDTGSKYAIDNSNMYFLLFKKCLPWQCFFGRYIVSIGPAVSVSNCAALSEPLVNIRC
jgi:hypothetical protein